MALEDYNKRVEYEVVNHIKAEQLDKVDEQYMNSNFTGWCIFDIESLEKYIINVTSWTSDDNGYKNFHFTSIIEDSVSDHDHQSYYHNLKKRNCDVKKIKIIGEKDSRRYTEDDPFGEEDWLEERMITKFKLFEEVTQFKEGNLKLLYRDSNLTVVVPLTSQSSDITCRGTGWCSRGSNYKNWANENILFRFLFKDGYKMRLTWRNDGKDREYQHQFTWGSGGEKYHEIRGKHPFDDIEGMKNHVLKEYEEFKTYKDYHEDNYYYDISQTKIEMLKRIEMIPEEAKQKVIEYRNSINK